MPSITNPNSFPLPEPLSTPCQEWSRRRNKGGYGVHKQGGKQVYAHRTAYERVHGAIPTGYQIDHLCRNRACVNTDHLEAVPKIVNDLRGNSINAQNARKTHCKRGHEFTTENTRMRPNGRSCKQCDRYRYWIKKGTAK